MNDEATADWSFILLLVGGLLISVASLGAAFMMSAFGPWTQMGWMMGASGPGLGFGFGFVFWMVGVGLVSGALVLVAAAQVRAHPEASGTWGVVGIVGGCLSLLAMGGYLIGALAAITGGVLAFASRTSGPSTPRRL